MDIHRGWKPLLRVESLTTGDNLDRSRHNKLSPP
jgi:hypothetical protein